MEIITVKVLYRGDGYAARAGRGHKAKTASSTSDQFTAAKRAAAKAFGLDASNVLKEQDLLVLSAQGDVYHGGGTMVVATPPTPEQQAALEQAVGWIDVVSPALARTLNELSAVRPPLVAINRDVQADSAGTLPFFRAQLTPEGRAALKGTAAVLAGGGS